MTSMCKRESQSQYWTAAIAAACPSPIFDGALHLQERQLLSSRGSPP